MPSSFLSAEREDLSFKVGDEIIEINKFDAHWWAGRIGNRRGIFPANHVEEKPGAAPSGSQLDSTITATALYDYVATQSDELSFNAGDKIVNIDKFDARWWAGRIGNRYGIFPSNRVSEN